MHSNDSKKKSQIPLLLIFLFAVLLSLVCVSSATLLAISTGTQKEIEASMLAQSEANYRQNETQLSYGQLNPGILFEATKDAAGLIVTSEPSNLGDALENFASTAVSQIFPTAKATILPPPAIATIAPEVIETAVSILPHTATPTRDITEAPSPTSTNTTTPTAPTHTATATLIPTFLPTATATFIPTNAATATQTPTINPPPATHTPQPPAATSTPVPSATNTAVPINTPIPTATNTPIATATNTAMATATNTATATATPTLLPTETATSTPTATATNIPSNEVLFIVGDKNNLNATDSATFIAFNIRGFTVTTLNDSEANPADTVGTALVYISSSIDSTQLGSRLRDVPVPIIVAENNLYDDMAMTGAVEDVDHGRSANDQDSIHIINDTHPLAGGLSGTVQVYLFPNHLRWGTPGPEAITIADLVDGSSNHNAIFAYETGSNMIGVQAPARRVAFFQSSNTGALLTIENGWVLFNAAVDWATGS